MSGRKRIPNAPDLIELSLAERIGFYAGAENHVLYTSVAPYGVQLRRFSPLP